MKAIITLSAFAALFLVSPAQAERLQVKARKQLCAEVVSNVVKGPLYLSECTTESLAQVFLLNRQGEIRHNADYTGDKSRELCVDAEFDFGPLILVDCKAKKSQWGFDKRTGQVKSLSGQCWSVPGSNFLPWMTLRAEPCKSGTNQQFIAD